MQASLHSAGKVFLVSRDQTPTSDQDEVLGNARLIIWGQLEKKPVSSCPEPQDKLQAAAFVPCIRCRRYRTGSEILVVLFGAWSEVIGC